MCPGDSQGRCRLDFGFTAHHHKQGRYAEAEELYKRSLAINEKTFGALHLNVAVALDHLAHLYWSRRYSDAAARRMSQIRCP
jgi:tetratricopeptide (TPR) repeat protein